jgi:Fe-S cluster biogenesis protein NfuA
MPKLAEWECIHARPALKADGGGVEFVFYADAVVSVKLKGSA